MRQPAAVGREPADAPVTEAPARGTLWQLTAYFLTWARSGSVNLMGQAVSGVGAGTRLSSRSSVRRRSALPVALVAVVALLVGPVAVSAQASTPPSQLGLPTCDPSALTITPAASPGVTSATPAPADATIFRSIVDVPLPGSASRFDYQSLDATSGRLFVAHMGADQVIVFDTRTQQVIKTVEGIQTPTGVLAVPELGRIFVAAAGSHDVAVIDAESLEVIAQIGHIGFPDGLDYAPAAKQVFVSDESGGGELVIDGTTDEVVTTIDIGGQAGNTHYDPGSGCILVAVQSVNQLAVIDPTTDRLVARYDIDADCQSPHGFVIDAPQRRAFVTCEDNAILVIVDLETMAATATYPVGEGPDVLAFDPGWRRLYVASEAGVISVFDEQGTELNPVGECQASHAHSVAVDPVTHQIYLPLENVDGKPVLRVLAPVPPS
jgi:YVTN family beta-propeller protein